MGPSQGRRAGVRSLAILILTEVTVTILLILLSASLAMDASAVSLSYGISMSRPTLKFALTMAVAFGLFQGLMPALGWSLGWALSDIILPFHHWVAFLLLLWVGGQMVLEGLRQHTSQAAGQPDTGLKKLLTLAFATSIDAFAVGITLAITHADIIISVLTIAAVTFLLCFISFQLGRLFGHLFGRILKNNATIAGGLILIAIGIKILIEH